MAKYPTDTTVLKLSDQPIVVVKCNHTFRRVTNKQNKKNTITQKLLAANHNWKNKHLRIGPIGRITQDLVIEQSMPSSSRSTLQDNYDTTDKKISI